MWRKGNPSTPLGYTGTATMKNSMNFPPKIKNRTTIWQSNFTSGYLSEANENTNLKRYMHPMFIIALFTIAKIWKQPECPSVGEWIKKM